MPSLRFPQAGSPVPPRTLADALAAGGLPLAEGLRCAGEIAAELRALHEQAQAYGSLTAHSVLLGESGARLVPLTRYWDQKTQPRDVHAFGALFYHMLTGTPPPPSLTASEIRVHGARSGPARLRPAAMKLALRCLTPKASPLSMQRVATELRLLGLLHRQYDARAADGAPEPERVSAPVTARTTPAAYGSRTPVVPLGPDSFGHPTPKPKAEPQPAGGACPACGSADIFVSRARSNFERTLERWRVPLCRCHRCYHRYIVFARLKIAKDMPLGTERPFKPKSRRA